MNDSSADLEVVNEESDKKLMYGKKRSIKGLAIIFLGVIAFVALLLVIFQPNKVLTTPASPLKPKELPPFNQEKDSILTSIALNLHCNLKNYCELKIEPIPETETNSKVQPISKVANSTEAYGFFFCTRPGDDYEAKKAKTWFFAELKLLVYKLKKIENQDSGKNRDVIVIICEYTTQEEVDSLLKLGALVIDAPPIRPGQTHLQGMGRWKDMLAMFHFWALTHWDRIVKVDIDVYIMDSITDIWKEPSTQIRNQPPPPITPDFEFPGGLQKADVPYLYPMIFSAVRDHCNDDKLCPTYINDPYFNSGTVVLKPNPIHYAYMIYIVKYELVPLNYPEQNVWNYMYNAKGPIPYIEMSNIYNDFADSDPVPILVDAKIVHIKLWNCGIQKCQQLKAIWKTELDEVSEYLKMN